MKFVNNKYGGVDPTAAAAAATAPTAALPAAAPPPTPTTTMPVLRSRLQSDSAPLAEAKQVKRCH